MNQNLLHTSFYSALFAGLTLSSCINSVQSSDRARYEEAKIQMDLGHYEQVVSLCNELIATQEWSSKVDHCHYLKGHAFYTWGDSLLNISQNKGWFYLDSAQNAFKNVQAHSDHKLDAQFDISLIWKWNGQNDSALSFWQDFRISTPHHSKADNATLEIAHYFRHQKEEAIQSRQLVLAQSAADSSIFWYKQVLALYPQSNSIDNAHFWLGQYFYEKRDYVEGSKDSALFHLEQYLLIKTDSTQEKWQLAQNQILILKAMP